ncbi:MAG: SDR family NAD(P)-dependent oxidoreductase [Bacteroidota bacterium]
MEAFEALYSLKGRVAVVTGGASGIGRFISQRLAEAGASVAVIFHHSNDAAKEAENMLARGNMPAFFVRADLREEQDILRAVDAIAEHFGRIDVLVNNAGVFSLSLQQDLDAAAWDEVMELNVRGLFLMTRETLKHMKEPGCAIVNISSINAIHPGFGQTAHYDASKGAVDAYTRSLAAELAPRSIRVNGVAPGLVDSEGLRKHAAPLAESVIKRTPLKKLASGEDVANAVLFLVSRAASHITGVCITVDGGYLLT